MNSGWNLDNSYSSLDKSLYSEALPSPAKNPKLIILNHELANSLNLDLQNEDKEKLAQIFCGNVLLPNSKPIAQSYAGHQFGHFVILGDGRAHLLGEQITKNNQRFDIQLKGSGRTPYSRNGDGKAALKPMLREYIISEAMHALNIETTRSLAVVATEEPVFREEFLTGAILTRVAKSHIRVGTFQFCMAMQNKKALRELANYSIKRHYEGALNDENPYYSFLKLVIEKQIKLICNWMRVGFIHGVMNTDNMSICGESIDYGPCAFMDKYDPKTVFSSIDRYGRYAFANQPAIAKWNLSRFAETLLPLLDENEEKAIEMATTAIESFDELFKKAWLSMMKAKLGLFGEYSEDEDLINSLLKIMQDDKLDYTNSFSELTLDPSKSSLPKNWLEKWQTRLNKNSSEISQSKEIMKKNNPVIIPRNHLVEEALEDAENGDMTSFEELLKALSKPYEENENFAKYKIPAKNCDDYKTFCGT
ncbi:MAG: YdiU family protein [Rickettsiales bacterium]|nr:YdiU family protein [Rickettsiales bacterium]